MMMMMMMLVAENECNATTHLTIDDRSCFLELLEEIIVGDIRRQVTNEAACCLAKLSLGLDVSPSKGLIAV